MRVIDEPSRYHVDRRDRRRYKRGRVPNEAWMDAALRHSAALRAHAEAAKALDEVEDDHDVSIDRKRGDLRIVSAGGDLASSFAAPFTPYTEYLLALVVIANLTVPAHLVAERVWVVAVLLFLCQWAVLFFNRGRIRFERGRLHVSERFAPWRARSYAAREVLRVEEVRFERDAWSLALQVRRGDAPPRWVLVRTKLRRHAEARELVEAIRGVLEPVAESTAYRSVLPSRDPLRNEAEPRALEARHTS